MCGSCSIDAEPRTDRSVGGVGGQTMTVTTAPHLPAGRLRGAGSCGSCRAAGHTRGLGLGKQYMAAEGQRSTRLSESLTRARASTELPRQASLLIRQPWPLEGRRREMQRISGLCGSLGRCDGDLLHHSATYVCIDGAPIIH